MDEVNHKEFTAHLLDLMACYPRFRLAGDSRARVVKAYWRKLKGLPRKAVFTALMVAPDVEHYPSQFPSAGELKVLIRKIAGHHRKASERPRGWDLRESEKAEAEELRSVLPQDPRGQVEYVQSAETETERLARTWEIEDLTSGRVPWCDTPREVGDRRFAELRALRQMIGGGA